jgi:hypothetical protein
MVTGVVSPLANATEDRDCLVTVIRSELSSLVLKW